MIDGSLFGFWERLWKEIFLFPPQASPAACEMAWCAVETWQRQGTRHRLAVEMAVSIKYHFQFPCFMIPRLLSTNNPPSAGPPTLSWGRLITLVAFYKKDIYMKIRKQLLCLHGSESGKKAIPNLIFIQRRGKITISWRLIWVSFGGRAKRGGWGEGAKTYVDWIKLANYFHATLMDVVFTHTMKISQIP